MSDINEIGATFSYDPDTGEFRWKRDALACKGRIIVHRAGDIAGSVDPSNGYVRLRVGQRKWWAHRVAWLLTHGCWPAKHIDHIKPLRHGGGNAPSNLRVLPKSKNRAWRSGA